MRRSLRIQLSGDRRRDCEISSPAYQEAYEYLLSCARGMHQVHVIRSIVVVDYFAGSSVGGLIVTGEGNTRQDKVEFN